MVKSLLTLAVLGLAALGVQRRAEPDAVIRFKEERMTLQWTATADEAVVVLSAETEAALGTVEILGPDGELIVDLQAHAGQDLALQGFVLETREQDVAGLVETYPAGTYALRAWTTDGELATGSARLTHDLLAPPVVTHPVEGEVVDATRTLEIRWELDPQAAGYEVHLEQNENDGLTVKLPGDAESFAVPPGVLLPGEPTQVEVGVLSRSGNCTLVEVVLATAD